VIDALAGLHKELAPYQLSFSTWKQNEKKLQQLVDQKAAFDQTESYKQHLLEELAALDLKENELENIEQELKFLENAVTIKSQLDASVQALDSSDNPIVQQIKQIANNLEGISKWQPEFEGLLSRLKAAQIELADIASELERWQDKIDFDENKIITLQERLSAGYSLQKKHKVQSTNELLAIQQQLETDLQAVLNIGEEITTLEKQVIAESLQVKKLATNLTSQRNKQVEPFTKKVNSLLKQVGMPNATIKVVIETIPYTIYGQDKVDILFDANNMNKYEPIRKVASGGELSRLMLCIKSLVAQSMDLPTMIFDEIDTRYFW
jgi:DNA repair protein RecN (Recombination protein N)